MRRMFTMEVRNIGKDTTEMGKACQVQLTAIPLTEKAEDGGGSHVNTLGQVLWDRETIQKEGFGRSALLIMLIILHNYLGISLIKPITSTAI